MSRKIKIADKFLGGGEPVLIQSMCNTRTYDAKATITQILELEKAGCDIIRVAVPDEKSADAIEEIKKNIREEAKEYTLFKNECGAWEMRHTEEIKTGAEGVYAFLFTRGDDTYVSLCYSGDDVNVEVPTDAFEYFSDVCGEPLTFEKNCGKSVIPVSHRRYIKTKLPVKEITRVLAEAKII